MSMIPDSPDTTVTRSEPTFFRSITTARGNVLATASGLDSGMISLVLVNNPDWVGLSMEPSDVRRIGKLLIDTADDMDVPEDMA